MLGLWHVATRTLSPGLGVVIFDGLAAIVVVLFTGIAIARRSPNWPEAWWLYGGLLLLSTWSVLHWIDVVIHACRARVFYSYILVSSFFNVIRTFSDVCVLWGTWRILMRYEHLRPKFVESRALNVCTILGGLLGFLAIYHLCLQFALSFAWLSFADLGAINDIAKARNGFEIAFTTVQFLSTILTAFWSFVIADFNSPLFEPSPLGGAIKYENAYISYVASVFLLIRSFCEVVIVGQLDRDPENIQDIFRARDITYSLFSLFFVGVIAFAVPSALGDPLVDTEIAAVDEVMKWVVLKLEEVTEHGRKTAPTMSALLQPLLDDSILSRINGSRLNCSIDSDRRHLEMRRNEVARLKALYADWTPIYKWGGEDGDSR